MLSSCILIFVKHPFDVGDRVDISDNQLVVERISLLFTVFKELKTHKTTQVSNLALSSLWIDNVSRSKAMREQLTMYISFDTSLEDIQLLRNEMQNFVLDTENARDFQPEVDVEVSGIAAMDKMELKVEIRHKSNWSNEAVRAARRSKFMCALVLALRKVPIYGLGGGGAALGSSEQPTYSVAVSDAEAASSRDAFAKAKEANRLFPTTQGGLKTPTPSSASFGSSINTNISAVSTVRNRSGSVRSPVTPATIPFAPRQEKAAIATLNARNPASDPTHVWEEGNPRNTSPTQQRDADIEEVRDVLRRQSTRGKRKTPEFKNGPPGMPTITEPDSQTYHDYMVSQGQVSVGPRLPVKGANESFGASFDPFPQQQQTLQYEHRPPQTPPKIGGPPQGKKASSYRDGSTRDSSIVRGQGRNNSFAIEREGV